MSRFTPPSRRYAGYIFDCDGTLVDSMPLHHRAWCVAFERFGAPFEFDWPLFMKRAGMPIDATVRELNAEFGCALPVDEVARLQHEVFLERLAHLEPIHEVVELARSLKGVAPMAVASGGSRPTVLRSLQMVGIADWFPTVFTASDVRQGKPHPEMMLACAQAMGVAPGDCLVIEDGQSGIDAAIAAGMDWVRVEAPDPSRLPAAHA